jgi:hypothetical protein
MLKNGLLIILFLNLISPGMIRAQGLPVGMSFLEDAYRREQLSGKVDSLVSFTIRPLFNGYISEENVAAGDPAKPAERIIDLKSRLAWAGNKGLLQILPLTLQQQYNARLPYGWNNGAVIPAAGYQIQISTGAYAEYGPLSIQLKPELIYAENKDFTGFPTDQYDVIWAKYYDAYFNVSDIPERFGEQAYSKLLWGQSSIRLNFDPVSVGLSNENLWWGPGVRSSLLMSNNGPGFKHITLNTTRPLKTAIGSFEAQVIAGRLENSGVLPPEINRVYEGRTLYTAKQDDWRYLSGFVFTYQPKWIRGLFVGSSHVSQMYQQNAGGRLGDFIPFLQAFENKKAGQNQDRLSSLFFRWLWQESAMEIYGEYGHNNSRSLKELLFEPDQSAAYLLGLRKMISLNKREGEGIQTLLEITELQQTSVPVAGGWYTSSTVRQGYTNKGQVLGAGIGPGGSLQTLDVSWIKGLKRIGLQLERYVHNNDFYYQAYTAPPDFRKHWVDLSATGIVDWDYRNLLLSAKGAMIRSLNYQYVLYDRPPEYFVTGWDRLNYHLQLGLTYRF